MVSLERMTSMLRGHTYIADTGSIAGIERVDGSREIGPGEVFHVDGGVVWPANSGAILELRLRRALVEVRLCHEDGERHVVHADVGPGDILGQSFPTDPRLESCGIYRVDDRDVVEVDVRDIRPLGLVLPQRANAHAVALVADCTTAEQDVTGTSLHGDRIVTVENDAVENRNVSAANVKAVCVEREALSGRNCVNHRVRNGDVVATNLNSPSYRFPRLEILQRAIGCVEAH